MSNVKFKTKTITPAMAAEMLKNNTHNRNVNEKHVRHLSQQMKDGQWVVNGESIKVNGEVLIDGQHRLHACIRSGISFRTLIVSGLGSNVFDTVDTGKARRDTDIFSINGESNVTLLATAIKVVEKYITGKSTQRDVKYSNRKMEELLEENPGIRDSVRFMVKNREPGLGSQGIMCGLHHLFSLANPEKSDEFMLQYLKGINIQDGSPILVLRKKMINASLRDELIRSEVFMAYMIKTWNAWLTGDKIKTLRFTLGGKNKEAFPVIRIKGKI